MMRWASLVCVCVAALSGCATFDDYHYLVVQHHRSDAAWKKYRPGFGHRGASAHYASGWKQGYYDLSTGGSGEPPAVPPSKYWSAKYQGPAGQAVIEDWYAGYQDGATAAESEGNGAWHAIATGPTIPVDSQGWEGPELVPLESPEFHPLPHPAPFVVPEDPVPVTGNAQPPAAAFPVSTQDAAERPHPEVITDQERGPEEPVPAQDQPVETSRRLNQPPVSAAARPAVPPPSSGGPQEATDRGSPGAGRLAGRPTEPARSTPSPEQQAVGEKPPSRPPAGPPAESPAETSRRVHLAAKRVTIPDVVVED